MNAAVEFDNALQGLSAAVQSLKQENERLRAETGRYWKAEADAREAQDQLRKCRQELEKVKADSERFQRDAAHWHRAVRYEQTIKKPARRKIHHLPKFGSVRRSKDDGLPYFPGWVNRERFFLRHWRNENKGVGGVNGGCGILELILSEDSNRYAADLTQRDATVAATLIQWLGTNCGQSFLHEVQRKIEKADRASRAKRLAQA